MLLHAVPGCPHPHVDGYTVVAILLFAAIFYAVALTRKDGVK